jgi:hypothetical protein
VVDAGHTSEFDPTRGSERAWLFGIATNLLRRHWRTEQRRLRAWRRASALERVPGDPLLEVARTREVMRARLVGSSTPDQSPTGPANDDLNIHASGPAGPSPRRYWLSIAAIVLIAAGLAAVIVAVTRPDPPAPTTPTGTVEDGGSPAYQPDTVPVVESLPNPFEANTNGNDLVTDDPTDEVGSSAEPTEPAFTPLALREPPAGYELGEAFDHSSRQGSIFVLAGTGFAGLAGLARIRLHRDDPAEAGPLRP